MNFQPSNVFAFTFYCLAAEAADLRVNLVTVAVIAKRKEKNNTGDNGDHTEVAHVLGSLGNIVAVNLGATAIVHVNIERTSRNKQHRSNHGKRLGLKKGVQHL